jgi:peroxiredoxin
MTKFTASRALLAAALLALSCSSTKPTPVGVWDATVTVRGVEVPFTFEITGQGSTVAGSFFDGEVKVPSTSGQYADGTLSLSFAQYGSRVDATLKNDRLEGRYDRGTRGAAYDFKATRATTPAPAGTFPSLSGEWRIPIEEGSGSNKGEASWRFLLTQDGPDVKGAIMRVDGDSGTLSGRFVDGRLVLSHFSGARPARLDVTPQADGTLALLEDGKKHRIAMRVEEARARAVPEPTDPRQYTTVRDRSEIFRFQFPDLDGQMVSESDPRFRGKVLLVSVTGSWCPNCHDEAPFLASLYRSHRDRGLEIVALAFEEADQLKNPERVRGFIREFGLTYPFLLAGTPEEAPAKIPQAVNLSTFPATFVLGRDGRVRAVHAGYASKATGDFYRIEQMAFVAEIEQLLAEPAPAAN